MEIFRDTMSSRGLLSLIPPMPISVCRRHLSFRFQDAARTSPHFVRFDARTVIVSAKKRNISVQSHSEKLSLRRFDATRRDFIKLTSLLTFLPFPHIAKAEETAGDKFRGEPNMLEEEDEDAAIQIFAEATPSVVSIMNFELPSVNSSVDDGVLQGTGSGFIWDKQGHIVTNYHVIAKLAIDRTGRQRSRVSVLGPDGSISLHDAEVIGLDSSRDLAVVKIDCDPSRLRPLPIGTSGDLRVGQTTYAIGNPLGFDHTLTTGVSRGRPFSNFKHRLCICHFFLRYSQFFALLLPRSGL
eukprot:TRINITY_DN18954_c0_g1_i1.p1 TRINITY_DN18954_c0_g1~~TRINITY_DN18954_c0_g1_i1.p1  ORF type:complete len:297 (-),score=22.72 TRINITY_DN18954_c0_g1_i1:100-990(-)